MLKQFKDIADSRGIYGEYIINRYKNSNYRLVVIATEFPGQGVYKPGEIKEWKGGMGFWQVDYPLTSYTFWKLMEKYEPIAVMTTSRNEEKENWVLEIGAKNLARANWKTNTHTTWNKNRPPYIGGSDIDPAKLWGSNAGHGPEAGDPPDATRPADLVAGAKVGREITDNVKEIQTAIITRLNAAFAPAQLKAKRDVEYQGIPDDNYVSAFAGYHAVWYNESAAGCHAGWHTHVDFGIALANATEAIRLQLVELIAWLDLNIP